MQLQEVHARDFWHALDALVTNSELVLDRPRGTAHPRYPDFTYPYNYLARTYSGDGHGMHAWIGSLQECTITGVIYILDLQKRDAEVKLLLGCTSDMASGHTLVE